ncbi:MAG: Mut7-C RNAse domain-containing protein [Calditrichia bacterium]
MPELGRIKFYVDNMLRGLATWLRFLGFPAIILNSPQEFVQLQKREDHCFYLTRSNRHYHTAGAEDAIRLLSDDIPGQLNELDRELSIFQKINLLSLCSICNVPVEKTDKAAIRQEVPEKVRHSFNLFYRCPECSRIYWEGGHIKRLKDKLKRMNIPLPENHSHENF